MCEPTTIAMMAVAVAGSLASLHSQGQAASAQKDHQNKLMIQRQQQMAVNQQLANQSAANEQDQVNRQLGERDIQASQKIQQNAEQAAQARAQAQVAKAESGVTGHSVDTLIGDLSRREGRYADSVRANIEGFRVDAEAQKQAIDSKRRGRIASVTPYIQKPVAGPDYLGAVVSIAGAGVSGYADYQTAQAAKLPKK